MRILLTITVLLGIGSCIGCGKNKPTNEYDITKDPNYHENADPRSYTGFYDNTALDGKKAEKKDRESK